LPERGIYVATSGHDLGRTVCCRLEPSVVGHRRNLRRLPRPCTRINLYGDIFPCRRVDGRLVAINSKWLSSRELGGQFRLSEATRHPEAEPESTTTGQWGRRARETGPDNSCSPEVAGARQRRDDDALHPRTESRWERCSESRRSLVTIGRVRISQTQPVCANTVSEEWPPRLKSCLGRSLGLFWSRFEPCYPDRPLRIMRSA
jgi:hypothetical protein